MMDSLLSIGELAKKANVNPSAIRYYESIGIMPIPARVNGQRRYKTEVIDQLKFIKMAQLAGFTNPEIATLLEGFDEQSPPSERWKQMAVAKRAELEKKKRQIDTMLTILNNGLDCKCMTWTECFGKIKSDCTCT